MNVSVPVETVFRDRSAFARRIVEVSSMDACGRASGYVNLNLKGTTMAQICPQRKQKGIALVLRAQRKDRPATEFVRIEVSELEGYEGGSNRSWLEGRGQAFYVAKGPAIAFLIPDAVASLGDDAPEWQNIASLLAHAKTLD